VLSQFVLPLVVPKLTVLLCQSLQRIRNDSFNSYSTSTYKLHYFETATGLKFVVTTDPKTPSLQQYLSKLYSDVYVEYVIKNPFCKLGEYINCTLFVSALEASIAGHPNFMS